MFETTFERIERMRSALRDEYGPDAESTIAAIDRDIELQLEKDPLLAFARDLFYRAGIALRRQRIDAARRLQSNGVAENMGALEYWLWDGRLIDTFVANLRPGEKLTQVTGFTLVTDQRSFSRAELKRMCRMSVEMNDASFERNFTSDEKVREVEARANYRKQIAAPGSRGGGVSNSDWRR